MNLLFVSNIVSFECSVVGRGGSRTALTGAVIMEQAGSTVGAGSARPSSPVVILLSQRAGKPRPYTYCHFGSHSRYKCFCVVVYVPEGLTVNNPGEAGGLKPDLIR